MNSFAFLSLKEYNMRYILTAVIYKLPGLPHLKLLKLKQVLTENN